MIRKYDFINCMGASGKKIKIIPTLEVYSKQDELIVYEEPLKNFSENLCRKILIEHYAFSPTEQLYGGVDIKEEKFYLFEKYVDLKPDFSNFFYQLSFDKVELLA